MDTDNDCDRNSGFDIKSNDFVIAESTVCIAWITQRCETRQIDSAVPFRVNRIRTDSFAITKMCSRCQQRNLPRQVLSMFAEVGTIDSSDGDGGG
jgi:hypothetical protein